jgi:hypothetical protein
MVVYQAEFVVIMSGKPQGGIKFRRRSPLFRNCYHACYGSV